jgi:hypothetical protein
MLPSEDKKMPAPSKEGLELKDNWKKFIDIVPVNERNRKKKGQTNLQSSQGNGENSCKCSSASR